MAKFEAKKIDFSLINNGNQFEDGDGVNAEAINAPIQASYYAQQVAEEAKRIAEEGGGGGNNISVAKYIHHITISADEGSCITEIENVDATPFTKESLIAYLEELNTNMDTAREAKMATGYFSAVSGMLVTGINTSDGVLRFLNVGVFGGSMTQNNYGEGVLTNLIVNDYPEEIL